MHATECFHLWQTHMWGRGMKTLICQLSQEVCRVKSILYVSKLYFDPVIPSIVMPLLFFRVLIQLNVFKPVSCIALWTTNVGLFKNKLYHYRIKVVSHIRIMSSCYIQYVISLSQCRTSKRFCKREISDRVLIII